MSEQKTILEWLELLPDGYREICQNEYGLNFVKHERVVSFSLSEAIASVCDWESANVDGEFFAKLSVAINLDNSIRWNRLPPLPDNWQSIYKDKLHEPETKKPKNPNKKRDKLAIKIYLAWTSNPNAYSHSSFEDALNKADEIIKKLNQ
jgi:hypothetical protein